MGLFNFWFRCIEQNCDWYRYIILVLSNKSQIPSWLNINHPKLKIVYHDSFIPYNELPTFNSSVIMCYLSNINILSEHFILFNDDCFAINTIKSTDFFNNNVAVAHAMPLKKRVGPTVWYTNINNNIDFVNTQLHYKNNYKPEHGPNPYIKSLQQFILLKYSDLFTNALSDSKFRQEKNFTDWLYYDVQYNMYLTTYRSESLTQYITKPNFNCTKPIICFNDTERLNDEKYNEFKCQIIRYLYNKFPNKSTFEIA